MASFRPPEDRFTDYPFLAPIAAFKRDDYLSLGEAIMWLNENIGPYCLELKDGATEFDYYPDRAWSCGEEGFRFKNEMDCFRFMMHWAG